MEVGARPRHGLHGSHEAGETRRPLTALRIASSSVEAGFPDGVINVVNGLGETAGNALVVHPKRGQDRLHGARRHGED